jgi:flavin reductase (DIM6/NTAB) family NADH-FMN oxidoreductase RutF
MKHFRQLFAAFALACILTVSSSAGDISCGITLTCVTSTSPEPETIPPVATTEPDQTDDVVIETALIFLQGVVSLF